LRTIGDHWRDVSDPYEADIADIRGQVLRAFSKTCATLTGKAPSAARPISARLSGGQRQRRPMIAAWPPFPAPDCLIRGRPTTALDV